MTFPKDPMQRQTVPRWRLVIWGIVAVAGVAAMGWFLQDRILLIAAVFFGLAIAGFGILFNWMRTSQWLQANARTLLWLKVVVIVANAALLLWDLLPKK
jgi:uncharacterized membrane protein HdeD (DUF308 family)